MDALKLKESEVEESQEQIKKLSETLTDMQYTFDSHLMKLNEERENLKD